MIKPIRCQTYNYVVTNRIKSKLFGKLIREQHRVAKYPNSDMYQ